MQQSSEHKPGPPAAGLKASLLEPLPAQVEVGRGAALRLHGRVTGAQGGRLEVVVDGRAQAVEAAGMPRAGGRGSGDEWWAIVPLSPVAATREAAVELRVDGDGEAVTLGTLTLAPGGAAPGAGGAPAAAVPPGGTEPLVAICMATYKPPPELLATQIESIRAQRHRNWICLISDDGSDARSREQLEALVDGDRRFALATDGPRLGFYGNFERALGMVPAGCRYVAFSDQDDRWHPDHLAALVDVLEARPEVMLAHCGFTPIKPDGSPVRAELSWTQRSGLERDLRSLLLCNTVPGAAALFRSELLEAALPFPRSGDWDYHDHWLALCAAAAGELEFVDRPLYDWVVHGAAVTPGASGLLVPVVLKSTPARIAGSVRRLLLRRFRPGLRRYYLELYQPALVLAIVLRERFGEKLGARDARRLRRFAAGHRSPANLAWLTWRSLRFLAAGRHAWGREHLALAGLAWRAVAGLGARVGRITMSGR